MRIALNATCLNDRPSGAKQRFLGIYRELIRLTPNYQYVVLQPADCEMSTWFDGLPNLKIFPTPIPSTGRYRKTLLSSLFWPRFFKSEHFDIVEGFHIPQPSISQAKTILTIHDTRYLRLPPYSAQRVAYQSLLRSAIRNTDLIVTVSDVIKQELSSFSPLKPIHVIPNGIQSSSFNSPPSTEHLHQFSTNHKLKSGFLLSVGHLEPRKNYSVLIDAIGHLRDHGHLLNLLIVGNDSGQKKELIHQINSKNLSKQIKILSSLSDLELRCAFHLCKLFIFPSTYEGFGIPVLEAMAYARPMVLSDIQVFHQITKGNSFFFNPHDHIDLANTILLSLSSDSLRDQYISYGLQRSLEFDYSVLASQYLELYMY